MNRILKVFALAIPAMFLAACGGGSTPGAGSQSTGNGDPAGAGTTSPAPMRPLFVVATGVLPYPTDLYFVGSTDGTLRLPSTPFLPNADAINSLDGFSTTAPITVRFSAPIDPSTLSAASVVVVRMTLDNATKAPLLPPAAGAQLPSPLVYGTDFTASVSSDVDAAGATLVITPNHPLDPSAGSVNIGYLVLVTSALKDSAGHAASPDADYATVKTGALADLATGATTPTCSSVTDATLNKICQLTFAHLAVAGALHIDPTTVALSFSFSTQSTADTLQALAQIYAVTPVPPGVIVAQPSGLTTQAFTMLPYGFADVWVGNVTLPYYLTAPSAANPTAPLTTHWTAAGPSPAPGIDPTSRKLTRFNPVPAKTADLTVPLLLGVPNATANGGAGCPRPANGYPAIVFMHGITGNRSNALAIMDAYANKCFVVAAIDQPLHGIVATDAAKALRQPGHERNFDLLAADGSVASSGFYFINLTSLLTSRDNVRQAESDLMWLAHILPTLSLGTGHAADIDPSQIQLAGQSLGSIVAIAPLAAVGSPYLSGMLSVPGGGIANLLRDSPTFSGPINAGLAAQGLTPGLTLYSNFFRDAQTAVDAGDPVNFIATAVKQRPILFQQVIGGGPLQDGTASLPDQVIPNSATARLLAAVGSAHTQRYKGAGTLPTAAGTLSYVNFIYGTHGSLLDPSGSANEQPFNGGATVEMQTEAVGFALAGGLAVTTQNGALLQP
jgi:dienelactone hydrolase